MADNRLVAVCLYSGCADGQPQLPRARKTILRYSYHDGWYDVGVGNEEFFRAHNHGLMDCIVFIPESSDDSDAGAERLHRFLHPGSSV